MLPRLVLALLLLAPALSFAFSSTPSGNTTTYTGFNAGAGNIGRYALSTASDGTVLVNSGGRLNVAGGGSIPINVQGSIPKASASAAIGRFLGRSLPVLGAGVALYQLAQELGYTASNAPDGTPDFSQTATTRPCRANWTSTIIKDGATCLAATIAVYNQGVANGQFGAGQNPRCSGSTNEVVGTCGHGFGTGAVTTAYSLSFQGPAVTQTTAVTDQAFVDAVAAKSGWPANSALASTVRDALLAGDALAVESPVVSGPATAPVSTTTTVDPVTGNTTTTVVTISNTYSGPTVTTTTTQTTTVTNPQGAPVGQPTVTTTAQPVTPSTTAPEESPSLTLPCGIAGLPPCNVKVDETQTPAEVSEDEFKPLLDEGRQAQEDLLDTVSGDADKSSLFDGFSDLFVTPALAECVPLEIPGDRGSIDPCGTVGGARAIMAYIWALSGLALCLHMVRKAL